MGNLVDAYGWQSAEALPSHNYISHFVIGWLRSASVRRVLDLGSGNGFLCGQLARAGLDVVGVEYDQAGVGIARAAHPRIPFYCLGVQDDPAQLLAHEAPFDVVVSTEVVEHLFAPHLLPKFASHVLVPGGRILLTTPYHGYLKNLALALAGKWDDHHTALWHGGHIKFWSRDTLGRLVQEQGFRVTEFHGIGRFPYLWKSMALVGTKATAP